jgi:hypothetical protein
LLPLNNIDDYRTILCRVHMKNPQYDFLGSQLSQVHISSIELLLIAGQWAIAYDHPLLHHPKEIVVLYYRDKDQFSKCRVKSSVVVWSNISQTKRWQFLAHLFPFPTFLISYS